MKFIYKILVGVLFIGAFYSCKEADTTPKPVEITGAAKTHNDKFEETINQKTQFDILGTYNINWNNINFTDLKFNDFYIDNTTSQINFAYNYANYIAGQTQLQYNGFSNFINSSSKQAQNQADLSLPFIVANFDQGLFYTPNNKLVYYYQDTFKADFKGGYTGSIIRNGGNNRNWRFAKNDQLVEYSSNQIKVGNKLNTFSNISANNLYGFYEPLATNADSGVFISISKSAISVYIVSVNSTTANLVSTTNFSSPIPSTSSYTRLGIKYSANGSKLIGSFIIDPISDPKVYTFVLNTSNNSITKAIEGYSLKDKYETSVPYSDVDELGNFYFTGNGSSYLFKNIFKVNPTFIENLGGADAIKITLATNNITHQNKIVGLKYFNNNVYLVVQSRITPIDKTSVDAEKQIHHQFLFLKSK